MSNAERLSASDPSETPKTRSRKARTSMEQHPSSGLSEAELIALGTNGLNRIMRTRLMMRRTKFSTGAKHSPWTRMIIDERRAMKAAREHEKSGDEESAGNEN